MATTQEQRDRITWFRGRRLFFHRHNRRFAQGLAVARLSRHQDARFLMSLFPTGAPASCEGAIAVFLQHDDPRCMCLAARLGAQPTDELFRRSVEGGYA